MSKSAPRLSIKLGRGSSYSEACFKSIGKFMILDNQAMLTHLLTQSPQQRDAAEVQFIASQFESLKFMQKIKEETGDETIVELARCASVESFKEGEVGGI
mmetsp:Transcript_6430/g.11211  ORF Transcript_6430/g.11211 Transcript_6430/m.11211 type:complete len:100 (-) Transcript_6430:1196-1495(-)